MRFLVMIMTMFLFSSCAHYEGYNNSGFWGDQGASNSAAAAANAGMMHTHHHTPAGMP